MRIFQSIACFLVMVGMVYADSPTTAPTRTTYTLGTDDNPKLSVNPTGDQVKAAMATLDGDKIHAVFISLDEKHCIQANWESAQEVSFQYVDGGDDRTYESRSKKYSREMAIKVLNSYLEGKQDWRKMIDWELAK